MRFLKFPLFFLCLALIVFFIGWVNIWIPSNHVAIVRIEPFTSTQQNPISTSVVKRKGFSWLWQRLVPGLSTLVILEDTPRTYTFDTRFALPQAFEYAAFSGDSIEEFTIDATIRLEYSLVNNKISDYVEKQGIHSAYALERILFTEISSASSRLLRENSILLNESTTTLDIQKNIKTRLQAELSAVPTLIQSTTVTITNKPNIKRYQYIRSTVQKALTQNTGGSLWETSDDFKNNKDALLFYLHFIQRLNGLANANPKIKDIMQIIPPQDILPE